MGGICNQGQAKPYFKQKNTPPKYIKKNPWQHRLEKNACKQL